MRKLDPTLMREISGQAQVIALPERGSRRVASSTLRRVLSPSLVIILQEAERELGLMLASESEQRAYASHEIESTVNRVAARLGIELTNLERDEILENIERESRPFGPLQELVDDAQVSDIIVSRYDKVSVQYGRRNLVTDLSFSSQEAYEAFVERLLLRAGSSYSTRKAVADGIIGSFARIHAVHRSICESGPYLTIRLNRFSSVNVLQLVELGTAPREIFDYLQGLISSAQTLLVVGEVGTGKTTLVRALASSMPAEEAILVIEDTPEIRLDHPHVRYITTRDENSDGAGRISPSQCIRAGMRMAMNRIIFGEMRDAEAAEAFIDVCASGHSGLSTIHARSALDAVARLELFLGRAQRGASRQLLSEQICTAVQAIVFVDICKQTRKRRIMEVREIGPVADGVIRQREIFRYQCNNKLPSWKVVNRLSAHKDVLESLATPLNLSSFPSVLELETNSLYREMSEAR